MRVLVVGSGGREHALVSALARDPAVGSIIAAPGNAGIAEAAECVAVPASDPAAIADLAEARRADLVVVGPEAPLVAGAADQLAARGIPCVGPSAAAARIEGSKAWAKQIMDAAGVPTARAVAATEAAAARAFLDTLAPPFVVKADGLAAGKGVRICATRGEADEAIRDCLERDVFGEAGRTVVVEEFLEGEELSVFCLSDGTAVLPLAESRDHKRAHDGDRGPNTGGMGAYSPVPGVDAALTERIVTGILAPTVAAMEAAGAPYRGVLYAGLMLTASGPSVLEFNCRLGDPEAQCVLPRLETDLGELFRACAEGGIGSAKPRWSPDACVTVVLASGGYPGAYETGIEIRGLDAAREVPGAEIFHAGTARRAGRLVTAGGRVLAVSGRGRSLAEARACAYEAASLIDFDGKHLRTDIAEGADGKGEE